MSWHTHLLLARHGRLEQLPDVFGPVGGEISFEAASTSGLAPHLAVAQVGDWFALWDPVGQVATGSFLDGTSLSLMLDGAADTYTFRWIVDGKLVEEGRVAPPTAADESWAFAAMQRLTGVTVEALEDATYRRVPFEDDLEHEDGGYDTSVLILRGGTLDGLAELMRGEYELVDDVESLERGQFPDPDLNCDLGAAEVDGWLVVWDRGHDTIWYEEEIEAPPRLLAGATAYAASLLEGIDDFGFRWFVDGELRRQLVMFRGTPLRSIGEPLREETPPEDKAGRRATWLFGVAERLTGLSWDAVESARYRRFRRRPG
jgi:hypothetical protein